MSIHIKHRGDDGSVYSAGLHESFADEGSSVGSRDSNGGLLSALIALQFQLHVRTPEDPLSFPIILCTSCEGSVLNAHVSCADVKVLSSSSSLCTNFANR